MTLDAGNSGVILDGRALSPDGNGLTVMSNGNVVKGLRITGFPSNGIEIIGGKDNRIGGATLVDRNMISGNAVCGIRIRDVGATGNVVLGNYIGVDASGTAALGNGRQGVLIGEGAQGNIIGGDSAAARNVISGNAFGGVTIRGVGTMSNRVSGNYIGLDATGGQALGNGDVGVALRFGASYNIIGGETPAERNIISGNALDGVAVAGVDHNRIAGNYIGTAADGTMPLGNAESGIGMNNAGTGAATVANIIERNVISANGTNGMDIYGAATTDNTVRGNLIGTDAAGINALGNGGSGISFGGGAHDNLIGGSTPGERNVISGNQQHGILICGPGADGNVVTGNYIGVDSTGMAALGNDRPGVGICDGAKHNRIGGATSGERNIVSGNRRGIALGDPGTAENVVLGNYVGLNASGTAALGNGEQGILIGEGAQGNIIGGDSAAARNVISANGLDAVFITGAGTMENTISGNYIGISASGTTAIPNSGNGVRIDSGASSNTVGGSTAGERNVISGNQMNGIWLEGVDTSHNSVIGNYVGTDPGGSVAVGNAHDGVGIGFGASYNTVGGTTAGERNVISGNSRDGVEVGGVDHNRVVGNYIGTDANGTLPLGNAERGIGMNDAGSGTATVANVIERNMISANGTNGMDIYGVATTGNTVKGNLIGVDAAGLHALGNGSSGIWIGGGAHDNLVGGSTTEDRNVISGNRYGVTIGDANTNGNIVAGNYIGVAIDGVTSLGNENLGVAVYGGAQGNRIGPANLIAQNGWSGVGAYGETTLGNPVTRNSIYGNAGIGIENVDGGNAEMPSPVITQLGNGNTVAGTACAGCVVEVFSDDAEEGCVYEGMVAADEAGNFSFTKSGGFARPNVTATATDASGNTSEFSAVAPLAAPAITHVVPNQGATQLPNEINIYGLRFSTGINATLNTAPTTPLDVQFVSADHVVGRVPAGLAPGVYGLTVVNPGGGSASLPQAYTVYGPASDDLFGYDYELWADPPTLRAAEPGGLGLIVHRQGGTSVLSNVVVRFYLGNPAQGGVLIGDGVIPLLSPNTATSAPRVNWTPPSAGMHTVYAVIDPNNAIAETSESNNVISRTLSVAQSNPDKVPPHVDSFTINDGAAATTSAQVSLDATASHNAGGSGVASLLYLEIEYSQSAGYWVPVQNSGWLPYATAQANYPWKPMPVSGMRYMQAWAADKAGNISLYPYGAYINYLPPTDQVMQGQTRVYRQSMLQGQTLTVRVPPVGGDPDLYVWPPDYPPRPPWVSNLSSGVDQVSFVVPTSGIYQIEVYGYSEAEYSIEITQAALAGSQGENTEARAAVAKPQPAGPAVPLGSEPGTQLALPPAGPPVRLVYLPVVLRR